MTRKGMRNLGFGIFALFSATAVSFLSFISMELAIAVFALTSVVFIVALERTRRAHWEQAVDFKIKEVNRKHSALSRQVMRNRNIVDNLEEDVCAKHCQAETFKSNGVADRRYYRAQNADGYGLGRSRFVE